MQLTFGARATASVQAQLQKAMALSQSQKTTVKNSKDNVGVDNESQTQATGTTTASSSVTGTGELSAQLMLGITASVSGSLTTAWKHTSSLSLKVPSRVDVMATTRRQIRRFDYAIPVTCGGWIALYYPEPAPVQWTPPQAATPRHAKVIAWPLGEIAQAGNYFDMADENRHFLQKGVAEVVAVRVGEHRVFQPEKIDYVVATGLGVCEGLALDGAGDRILVSNHAGELWQISLRAARGLDGVGMVVVPPERRA
ncbi:hypothetical protein ABTZ58_31835 [Streptomyces sp. NPDC094143]|uniref:hypothetical protein n=1 Tax=Streptomyces sp. NPDC094143 TaxID=3155310 RepID=UPI00333429FA